MGHLIITPFFFLWPFYDFLKLPTLRCCCYCCRVSACFVSTNLFFLHANASHFNKNTFVIFGSFVLSSFISSVMKGEGNFFFAPRRLCFFFEYMSSVNINHIKLVSVLLANYLPNLNAYNFCFARFIILNPLPNKKRKMDVL